MLLLRQSVRAVASKFNLARYSLADRAFIANFGRDGMMNVNGNQGSRPSLLSTEEPINLSNFKYTDDSHIQWTVSTSLPLIFKLLIFTHITLQGGAVLALTRVTEMDFEWPRFLWGNLTKTDQNHLIRYVSNSHLDCRADTDGLTF